ncbi:MAG: aminopeptidase P family protein [bacterium]|nr:MAG: aminopeptidase P family protein [bacterium]
MSRPPLFHFSESYQDADQYYLSGFLCQDPFAVLETGRRKVVLGVSPMEEGRARKEAPAAEVVPLHRKKGQNLTQILGAFLRRRCDGKVRVLPTLSLGLAQDLRAEGIGIEIDGATLARRRRSKTGGQIGAIESVQRACEGAMAAVRALLAGCPVRGGVLQHGGEPLTAEKVRSVIEVLLLESGLETADTIVAPGRGGSDPHWRGAGELRAGVPVVVDIFPRSRLSRYHSDMTRTFVVGRATPTVRRMHEAVLEAQDVAISTLRQGVRLADVHDSVCDVLRKRGYGVPGGPRLPRSGLLHGTGHGLGLQVHEAPSVSVTEDTLEPGDVITIEPGLYDARVGGVRLEDVVACMPDGSVRNLTRFPRELEIV